MAILMVANFPREVSFADIKLMATSVLFPLHNAFCSLSALRARDVPGVDVELGGPRPPRCGSVLHPRHDVHGPGLLGGKR